MGYLKYIELDNFKSYKGSVRIGPFKSFTAIIGPNGSGKSNLMDAISFVLGESTKNLRVKKLSDLIHGAPIGKPVANRATVSFVYSYEKPSNEAEGGAESDAASTSSSEDEVGKEIKFTRNVLGSSSEFRIDGKVTSSTDYQNELEKLGIYLKAKNFLVYQGQVESIAMKNAKDIANVFEEISRSVDLKEEYERLKADMEKAELDTQTNFQKKRGVAAQKKEAKMEKEEAEKYQKLRQELREQEQQLRLYQLYYNEKGTEDVRAELEQRQREIRGFEQRRDAAEDEIRDKKRKQGQGSRELAKVEEHIKELELKLARKKPQFIKAKESSSHLVKKLDTAKTCYEAALKANETHLSEIELIKGELEKLAAERAEFEARIQQEWRSQGVSMELRDSQMKQYQKLKEAAAKRNAEFAEKLGGLQREQKMDQDALDNEGRKRSDAHSKIKQKQYELEEQRTKLAKLSEYLGGTEAQIAAQRDLEASMEADIERAKGLCVSLEAELAKVMGEIGEARVDKFEQSRSQKKGEIIEQLKKKFAGVYGRLIDHCEPVHRKYQVAITKVMGKSMDAIVVDTERTARDCIKFMKEQHLQAETFYPLDYIEAVGIDERLRDIREPRNTKMLVDVIKSHPPQIKRALLFAVGNCLVCESDEDARQLALWSGHERHKVVSFEGTLFQKSGVISGGSNDLRQKAKRWDEKHLDQLRRRKDDYSDQLKEQYKIRRKEPELIDLRSNVKGLEARLKYTKVNKDMLEAKTIVNLEKDLAALQSENGRYDPKIKEIEGRMAARLAKINKLQADSNQIDDEVFGDFCVEIGVANIRVYEERELAGQQETVKERAALEERRGRLNTQLEFEMSRDTLKSFKRWQKEMAENERELGVLRADEDALVKEIAKVEEQIEAKRASTDKFRAINADMAEEIDEMKKKLSGRNKEINDMRKKINSVEAKLLDRRLERHAVLKNAKLELIELPMLRGTMDDISDEDQVSQPAASASAANEVSIGGTQAATDTLNTASTSDQADMFEREARIKINYKKLDTEYLNLEGGEDVDKTESKILARIHELRELLNHFAAPSMRVDEKLDSVTEMWEKTTDEFDRARQTAKKARNAFLKIKEERYKRFIKCFEHINARIDDIYKALCMNQGAQASLVLENAEEPYTEGIIYNCVAPGKRFRQMDNLSGGEKTVAALALLFAVRSYNPSPFFVLDEVDAALDNTNISKVANYIKDQAVKGLQCIVISLKEEFFQHAHSLVGVYPIANDCIASEVISVDLTKFTED